MEGGVVDSMFRLSFLQRRMESRNPVNCKKKKGKVIPERARDRELAEASYRGTNHEKRSNSRCTQKPTSEARNFRKRREGLAPFYAEPGREYRKSSSRDISRETFFNKRHSEKRGVTDLGSGKRDKT